MKIAVIVDSGSDYYNQDIKMDGLYAIPLQIIEGDNAYLESVEISNDQVNNLMIREKTLQTSLPVLGQIEDLFKQIKNDGYESVFAVPITSGISGTLDAMRSAAMFADLEFDYIDCYTTCHVQLECAFAARTLLDKGYDIETVKARLNDSIDHSNTYIIPDDLSHLSRGGRLSPLAARLGGLLRIKPILHLDKSTKGVIDPFDKVRTMTKAIDTVIEDMKKQGVDETYMITLAEVNAPENFEKTTAKLQETFPDSDLALIQLISTVSVHVGIGSIALQYMKKVDLS